MLCPRMPVLLLGLFVCAGLHAGDAAPMPPRVDYVEPLPEDPLWHGPGVFFHESFEEINQTADLKQHFPDTSLGPGKFILGNRVVFSGKHALDQTYIPRDQITSGDKGSAGWVTRFFGDSPLYKSRIKDKTQQTHIWARWYHKFDASFYAKKEDKIHFPPKLSRMRCYQPGWKAAYTILFWIEGGPDAGIVIERHTRAPGTHRQWLPKYKTQFYLGRKENLGRWICMELAVILGDGPKSDQVMAWADGKLICYIPNDDLAAGWKNYTLNAMMWDCYWNGGSPAKNSRYYDDFILSNTQAIGPARTSFTPKIILCKDTGDAKAFEIEVAEQQQKPLQPDKIYGGIPGSSKPLELQYRTVWQGKAAGTTSAVTIGSGTGTFVGPLNGKTALAANTLYVVRVRRQAGDGTWTAWSSWHAAFATNWAAGTKPEDRTPPRGYLIPAVDRATADDGLTLEEPVL